MPVNKFIFCKVATASSLTRNELSTSIIQRFCQLFRSSCFQELVRTATRFSRDFVANFVHVFASSVVGSFCLSYCLQKETNSHKHTCVNIRDMVKLMSNILLLFGPLLLLFSN